MLIVKTSRMTLMERLKTYLNHEVAMQAEGFDSEPGLLQNVGKRFIRVDGKYYVPSTMQEIVLLDGPIPREGRQVYLHTTYGGVFQAVLVRTGIDFIEAVVTRQEEEEELRVLIPMNKIIGMEE